MLHKKQPRENGFWSQPLWQEAAMPSAAFRCWSNMALYRQCPPANWTYLVMAADEVPQEITRSNRVGEVDYLSDIP
jgi:hypothetical protein